MDPIVKFGVSVAILGNLAAMEDMGGGMLALKCLSSFRDRSHTIVNAGKGKKEHRLLLTEKCPMHLVHESRLPSVWVVSGETYWTGAKGEKGEG